MAFGEERGREGGEEGEGGWGKRGEEMRYWMSLKTNEETIEKGKVEKK